MKNPTKSLSSRLAEAEDQIEKLKRSSEDLQQLLLDHERDMHAETPSTDGKVINLADYAGTDKLVFAPSKAKSEAYCWVTVGNVSLKLKRDDQLLTVEAYPLGHELGDPVDVLDVWFSDAQDAAEKGDRS